MSETVPLITHPDELIEGQVRPTALAGSSGVLHGNAVVAEPDQLVERRGVAEPPESFSECGRYAMVSGVDELLGGQALVAQGAQLLNEVRRNPMIAHPQKLIGREARETCGP